MAARAERKLDKLPPYRAPPVAWREWLTKALSPAAGHKIEKFLRHGRQRTDMCEMVVSGPDGQRQIFELGEQRHLSTANALRATIVAATDGLLRPDKLTVPELEDIWIALVALATVTAEQSQKDETREWLEETVAQASPLTGHTLTRSGQRDALSALLGRDVFNSLAAQRFTDPKETTPPRPALLIDNQTGERWMRVGDLAAFWRHVIVVGVMSQPTIDGRLSAIGVRRHSYACKDLSGRVLRARLYRVADVETGR
jgi:hypothetical protein